MGDIVRFKQPGICGNDFKSTIKIGGSKYSGKIVDDEFHPETVSVINGPGQKAHIDAPGMIPIGFDKCHPSRRDYSKGIKTEGPEDKSYRKRKGIKRNAKYNIKRHNSYNKHQIRSCQREYSTVWGQSKALMPKRVQEYICDNMTASVFLHEFLKCLAFLFFITVVVPHNISTPQSTFATLVNYTIIWGSMAFILQFLFTLLCVLIGSILGRRLKLWKATQEFVDNELWGIKNYETWDWKLNPDWRAHFWMNSAFIISCLIPGLWPLFVFKLLPGPLWCWLIPSVLGTFIIFSKGWFEKWESWIVPVWSVIWSLKSDERREQW